MLPRLRRIYSRTGQWPAESCERGIRSLDSVTGTPAIVDAHDEEAEEMENLVVELDPILASWVKAEKGKDGQVEKVEDNERRTNA